MINRIISFFLALITSFSLAVNFYRPGKGAEFESHYEKAERNMEKYTGVYSSVEDCGGVPTLFVNGEPFPAAAYMTYLEEYNNYSQFANAGYTLFSVPVLFAGRWISVTEGLTPFHGGIFDVKCEPDFSSLDESVGRILSACPDAYIFPRVNLSMPLWWIEENPDCLDGTGKRELLCSLEFRETAADMLRQLIDYVNSSPYASHIVGYQIAGGNTEEWFYFDMNAGCCENAVDESNAYLEKYYPGCGFSGLPDLSLLNGKGTYHKNEHLTAFLEFSSYSVADTICYLSSVAKEATGGNVVVGTFYGYSLEVTSSLQGAHALKTVLACDNIDFICSPNSYIGLRNNDYDWTEMYPAASVRLHGKLCMQECDIRTYLTRLLGDAAPEYDPEGVMNAPIWHPLESREQSIAMIRKSFSRQLIKGNGFWWFDMWGGWYNDEDILAEMARFRSICADSLTMDNRVCKADVAAFVDESAYNYLTNGGLRNSAFNMRSSLGLMGANCDIYDISDYKDVADKYKGVIFLSGVKTDYMNEALDLCKKRGVKYISVSDIKKDFTVKELRAFCESAGAHIYCKTDDLVYANDNYIAIHSSSEGEKNIYLDGAHTYRELLCEGAPVQTSDKITVNMKNNETRLFEIVD